MEKFFRNFHNWKIYVFFLDVIMLTASTSNAFAASQYSEDAVLGKQLQPSSNMRQIPEDKVMRLKKENSPANSSQLYFCFEGNNDNSSISPAKEENEMTLVNVNIDIDDFEYLEYVEQVSCYVYSKSHPFDYEFAWSENPYWYFDSPLQTYIFTPGDDYVALVEMRATIPDYKGTGIDYGAAIFSLVKDIDVSGESVEVTVRMADANRELEFIPIDNEGNSFASIVQENSGTVRSIIIPKITLYGYSGEFWIYNNAPSIFITPELDENCKLSGEGFLYYKHEPKFFMVRALETGPFTHNITLNNNPENYMEYSSDFCLTPQDKTCYEHGVGYVEKWIILYDWGPEIEWWDDYTFGYGEPFEEAHIFTCLPDQAGSRQSVIATKTRTKWNEEEYSGEWKVSGNFAKNEEGKLNIVGNNLCRDGKGGYTFFSPVPEFNIDPSSQNIVNFYNTLFGSAYGETWSINGETIEVARAYFIPTGYYNEHIEFDGMGIEPESFKLNGKTMSHYDEVYGQPFKDSELEFNFKYDNILVEDTYPCTLETTVGINTYGDDFASPCLVNFQIRDEKGNICTRIPSDQKGKLLLAANDNSNKVASIEISVAPDGSDDYMPLAADVIANEDLRGSYAIADLSNLEHDIFYTVKVLVKDEAGNYCVTTIPYAFNITTQSVNVKEILLGNCSNVEYYNLQGMRIFNPQPGQIYIVKRDNLIFKEIYCR